MSEEQNETLDYLRSVIDGRSSVEWFTDSITGSDLVSAPMDVFVHTTDGAVTWGWSVQPVPVDPGLRAFRRFRSDDLFILTDADEPELVFIPHTVELHSISSGRQAAFSVGIASSAVPDASTAFDLEKAARSLEGRYSIDPAFPHDTISRALELWVASLLEEDVEFTWIPLSDAAEAEIEELTAGGDDDDEPFVGFDEEIADILSDFASIAWFQADLTWPDSDNAEAFRDHIDVRFRSPSEGLVYLASIGPLGSGDDPWITATDSGGLMSLDRSDPTVVGLAPDRLVVALSRTSDGYEPAGVATAWGHPPTSDEWAELRKFAVEHEYTLMIHAPGWSEDRVADALATWARLWGDVDVEFGYDYDDAIPQATIAANEALAEASPQSNQFVRTATANRCVHTQPGTAPNEVPFPCGRPATHYYTPGDSSEGVVLVCDDHVPWNVSASPLLK